jgi:endonuclease/exonuclease/phosphatase family metal-dependent hydrolase
MPVSLLISLITRALLPLACVAERVVDTSLGLDGEGEPTIMVLTYNQENTNLDDHPDVQETLIKHIAEARPIPNLIFFCEQEARGSRLSKILTQKNEGVALAGFNYNDEFKASMNGITDFKTNHQALSMLHNGDLTKVTFAAKPRNLGKGFKKTMEGKGGIVAKVTFEYRRQTYSVGIGCAHLDSKNEEIRSSQLQQMVGFLKRDNAEIQLLSGDLNYRAQRMPDVTTRSMLVDKLSTQEGVSDILAHDTLKNTMNSLGCTCNQPGAPGAMYGPTYKRIQSKPTCSQYSGTFPRDREVIGSCFFNGTGLDGALEEGKGKDLKNGEHQLGYLDRLCSCGGKHGDAVAFVYQKGVEEVTVSDHIPVINVVSL